MQILVLGDKFKKDLQSLKEHAEKNPYSMDDLLDVMNKSAPIPGDIPEFRRIIPIDIMVVFTIENQVKCDLRHCSISVKKKGVFPNPHIIQEIITELGFKSPLKECHVTQDTGCDEAISIIEIIKINS